MAFPITALDFVVELALGADLTASPSTWVWTPTPAVGQPGRVLAEGGITITRGGRDGSIQSPPSTCIFRVDNSDGRWVPSNPSGIWYGQLTKGTPIRVRTNETASSVRWTGFLTSLPPRWYPGEFEPYVDVKASGILQRLQRGKAPLRSALVRTFTGTTRPPVAYWPGGDGSGATSIAEFSGGAPMRLTGQVHSFASDGPSGSSPLVEFTTVAGAIGTVPSHTATGEWSVAKVFKFPATPPAETVILQWRTNGTYPIWQVTLSPDAGTDFLSLQAVDTSGAVQIDQDVAFQINANIEPYGQWLILFAGATQVGADVDYSMFVFTPAGGAGLTGTETGITAGTVTVVREHATSKLNGMHAGHWAAWDLNVDPIVGEIDPSAIDGYDGETVVIRAVRLAQEGNGPYVETDGQGPQKMGPQTQATYLTLLRECEAVGGGRLYENRDPTEFGALLRLKFAIDLENLDAALVLIHDSGHLSPAFEPTDDDQNLINDVTATRSGAAGVGSSARVVATLGEHGNLTPELVGTYDDSVSVNVYLDDDLIHQAGWRVGIGTHEGLRFPVVTLDLAANPSLIADWLTCDIGSRVTITNPPRGVAPDDIDLLIEGWTETLGALTWTVQLFCSPYKPWHVIQVAETSGDIDPYLGRLAGDEKCALRIAVNTTETAWVFDPNFYRWTIAADDFPMDIRIGGEVVTLSAIANGATLFIAAGAASHADNAAVSPAIYAGASVRQVIFVLAAIRSSGTGTLATPAGYTRLPVFGASDNVQLYAKVHDGSESAPTITPSGGSAGDTVSAFTFGFTNISNTVDLADVVVENAPLLNASAANIAYGGVLAPSWCFPALNLIVAWKQDDFTSIAVPAGFTEIAEASTVTGNDQSLYAAFRLDTTPTVVNEGSLVVTGGAAAISRSAVVCIPAGVQSLTVSARSVNGVVKSHAVGARIEVEDAGVLAL
jgi:hypothetical protein